jgi:hypothetical protein
MPATNVPTIAAEIAPVTHPPGPAENCSAKFAKILGIVAAISLNLLPILFFETASLTGYSAFFV